MDRFRSIRRSAALGVVTCTAVLLVACAPQQPDGAADVQIPLSDGLKEVTAEPILAAQPAGVTRSASIDEPADNGAFSPFNTAIRTFSAPSEQAAAAAAGDLLTQALADGWTGSGLEDPGGGGVPTAVLTKGAFVLEISYTTEVYKQNWPNDDDGFEVRMTLSDEPSTSEIPADGQA